MRLGATLFLKTVITAAAIGTLAVCIFLLPWLSNYTAEMYPEFAYLQYPVLVGLYIVTVPFLIALYSTLKLLGNIDRKNIFSESSVRALARIKYCAIAISMLFVLGGGLLIAQDAAHPSVSLVGITIIFASATIAVFAAVLQQIFQEALNLKSENDLTV